MAMVRQQVLFEIFPVLVVSGLQVYLQREVKNIIKTALFLI